MKKFSLHNKSPFIKNPDMTQILPQKTPNFEKRPMKVERILEWRPVKAGVKIWSGE